ncbi:MAG: hypothetical protein H0T44_06925 [Gemmatimonadales bacterium]|nr:hypothetical protein [Gemmatimonadales bacterium]MDQ3427530.1 hypothetical protein [Gemmatimonadota bacterium]
MSGSSVVERVTCLGCGCTCDDVAVEVRDGRIVGVTPPCPVGRAWFGDGSIPEHVLVSGSAAPIEAAITEAARLLVESAGELLVYLGPDVSAQAQRAAVALADRLRAAVDSATSEPAAAGLLAAQRRGRAAATLGEIRNRADVLMFWGVDPTQRYPRYLSRYALEPAGTHVPAGRAGRRVISVSIGTDRGPTGADVALEVAPEDELAALSVMRATALGHRLGELPERLGAVPDTALQLTTARYAVLVHEAELSAVPRSPHRTEGLIALTQALNGVTRAALSSLRAGGNRSGAESVLTWQTGFPMSVDFSGGFPRYSPGSRGLERLRGGGFAAVLIVGSAAELAGELEARRAPVHAVVIGPRASEAPLTARVAIDTGVAGIHEGGTAYRMDEVPLPLRPPLPGARSTAETLGALLLEVRARLAERSG